MKCRYYCIQVNSTHSTHLIALTPLRTPVFCFKAAFKCSKYKDLELHLVPFVRGVLQNLSLCNTSEYTARSVFFCLKATALIPTWSILAPHFSHFVHYQTDDWRCRKAVRRHSSLCFCFHRDISNGQHPANLNRQSLPFTFFHILQKNVLERSGGMSGMWRSP